MIKNKKLKGFTLVEIIVALAVFAIMSLVVALIIQMSATIMKDSQYTTKKADTHTIIANSKAFTTEDDDTVITKVSINGASLDTLKTVEIEGNDNRDAEYDDNSFYENAPNIKVFAGSGTKTY
ncbi:MAG: type II secretion system protein [Oscillospiraceae bacterium]|nr:type II secretion system protein [Oscillospiraceae bacterium]